MTEHKFKVGEWVSMPGKNGYAIHGQITHMSGCGRYLRILRVGTVHFGRASETKNCERL